MTRSMIPLIVFTSIACYGSTEPVDRSLEPAQISGHPTEDPDFSIVQERRSLRFSVVTYGNGCTSKGELRLEVNGEALTVTVAPFDWQEKGVPCEDILRTFQHTGTVNLGSDGTWTIVLTGRNGLGEDVTFERTIEVEAI